jgi:hypothetical protein
MKTVWKYSLHMTNNKMLCELAMPRGARILHTETWDQFICMWALVETDAPFENRFFRVFSTGEEIKTEAENSPAIYVGSASKFDYILHVFEVLAPVSRVA